MNNHTLKKDIKILDDVITEKEQRLLLESLTNVTWRYDWPINSTPYARPCWHFFIAGNNRSSYTSCEKELSENDQWYFLAAIWERLKQEELRNTTLLGVYANGQTFSQDSPIHRDNPSDKPGKTVVLFCNDYWATCWGGELVFFDDDKKDIIGSILPRPGRVAIFNGRIPHRARSPTIDCNQLRVTIAFKTINEKLAS